MFRRQTLDSRFQYLFKVSILLTSLVWYLTSCTPTHAQSVNLSVSPPVVEILLSPNKKVTQTFTLDLQGGGVAVTPELHLAKPADLDGHMTIEPEPLNPSTIPLSVNISSPTIHNPQSTIYNLTFEAASTDVPQDVYLALVFKANSNIEHGGGSTPTIPAISALILATITPTGILPISLDVQNFTLPVILDSWSPLTIHPTLQNHSSTMIRPLGQYTVISPTGKTVFSLPLYPNLILSNSSRLVQGSDKPITNIDELKSTISPLSLTWQPRWYDIGPYRLHLTITSEGGTKLTEVEKVVWLFPIRLSILLIFFIISIFTLTLKLTKKLHT